VALPSILAVSYAAGKESGSMHDKVDVLIIGSGASGVAVAYSLADTKMRIICLERATG